MTILNMTREYEISLENTMNDICMYKYIAGRSVQYVQTQNTYYSDNSEL